MIFKPHNYQDYCIRQLVHHPKRGLFLDMSLGKTIITLSAIRELKYNRFQVNKVLIIAPKKVADGTWPKESGKWDHTKLLHFSKVLGSEKKRIQALCTPADIYVINRENVTWLVDHYQNKWPFDMVVVDESSSFKSHKAKCFKSLTHVLPHISRMVILTGTPSPKGVSDLWSQIYLLDEGERLEKSYTQFRVRYLEPDKRGYGMVYSYKPVEGAEDLIKEKISDICISMRAEDYLELPDIIMDEVPVYLDDKAKKSYKELEYSMLLEVPEGVIDAASAAALTNKLLQLGNGAVYDAERNIHEIHNCKMEAFLELLEKLNGKPALVFYNFKHDLARIQKALAKSPLRIRLLQTTQDVDDWNAGQIDLLLAHPASAAYGLNLQEGGNHIIWFGLNWNLEQYQQANKRLHRQGQTEKVFVHHLITQGTRDEDVMAALESKGDMQERLMESLKVRIEEARQNTKNQNNPMKV